MTATTGGLLAAAITSPRNPLTLGELQQSAEMGTCRGFPRTANIQDGFPTTFGNCNKPGDPLMSVSKVKEACKSATVQPLKSEVHCMFAAVGWYCPFGNAKIGYCFPGHTKEEHAHSLHCLKGNKRKECEAP